MYYIMLKFFLIRILMFHMLFNLQKIKKIWLPYALVNLCNNKTCLLFYTVLFAFKADLDYFVTFLWVIKLFVSKLSLSSF